MPGLYLHIPFCKKACHYCNFHFSTSLKLKEGMLNALIRELEMRSAYLRDKNLDSVYFGGGTPSLLDLPELERLFTAIVRHFSIRSDAEITLEANPDDLNPDKLLDLKRHTPVNRLSIGIQSFFEDDLVWMNRAHNARDARLCLEQALATGFNDLSIDLIYGSPTTSDEQWARNLEIAFDYQIPHLSSYCLTVEEGTALGHFVKKGKQPPLDEIRAEAQFRYLMEASASQGMVQYEISNFALPGHFAKHNSSYWLGAHYLGIGPSAHSFDGESRQWNIANNALYIQALENGALPFERETLTAAQRYNEYVMTGLRTIWGVELQKIRDFGEDIYRHFLRETAEKLAAGMLESAGDSIKIPSKNKFLSDGIASDLFLII